MRMVQPFLVPPDNEQASLSLLDAPRMLEAFANDDYSAYLNQALYNFVESNATADQEYAISPLLEDLVAGKNTYVYDAHTYHTKVPPEAIIHLIEHFTQPGDLILDPFCGSGMTGVAALRTKRKPILTDLSPAATFIALNFLTPIDAGSYKEATREVLMAAHDEEMLLYGTRCRHCGKLVPMEYTVWSYGLVCEFCEKEFVLWNVARDEQEDVRKSKIRSEFDCPHCAKHLQKRRLQRTCLYPVQIGYRCCDSGLQESKAVPDDWDLSVIQSAEAGFPADLWYPTAQLPNGVNTRQAITRGLKSVDALYTARNLRAVARLWDFARRWPDQDLGLKLMFTVTSLYQRVTRLSEFRFWGGSGNIANYNVPMIFNEQNVFKVFERKAKTIRYYLETWQQRPEMPFCLSTQSATDLSPIPNDSIDYIFTDPPFGGNINYSEMNYLWEAWLGVFTSTKNEAIVNRVQGKSIADYRDLMAQAIGEMHRVLKPRRWLTLVFHNSSAEVWVALQSALASNGFEVEKIQTLDKRHGTFKQFVSDNAVGYDLVIHCQKRPQDASPIKALHTGKVSNTDIRQFLAHTLEQNPDGFVVQYQHVERQSELDSRKLYSMWLQERIEAGEIISLDYEDFRRVVKDVVKESPQKWVVREDGE